MDTVTGCDPAPSAPGTDCNLEPAKQASQPNASGFSKRTFTPAALSIDLLNGQPLQSQDKTRTMFH
jgi:hypothetical protein